MAACSIYCAIIKYVSGLKCIRNCTECLGEMLVWVVYCAQFVYFVREISMTLGKIALAVVMGLILLAFMGRANAELGEHGVYSGQIGFITVSSDVVNLSEDHVFIVGRYSGTSTNSSGGGFLHNAAWICSGTTEVLQEESRGIGYCTVTDQDGDKISGKWTCADGDCDQYFNIGGTGKYQKLRSHNKFDLVFIGLTGHFVSVFRDGEYTISE